MDENNSNTPECNHVGTHGPVAQQVLNNGVELMIILSHNCMNCGKLFSSINIQPLQDVSKKSSFALPMAPNIKGPKA